MVYSCSLISGRYDPPYNDRVADILAIEENNCICLLTSKVGRSCELDFIDIRIRNQSKGWTPTKIGSPRGWFHSEYPPKLAWHGGKLICSTNDGISVFSGPKWEFVSRYRKNPNANVDDLIRDFSIGGGRLFAICDGKYDELVDVWDAPPPPVI